MSAQAYKQRIDALRVERYFADFTVSNVSEAKKVLAEIRDLQQCLRQIKREINHDMKAIRTEYRQRLSDVASEGGFELLGQRKIAGRRRADKGRRFTIERDQVLAPYEALNLAIDSKLAALENIKLQLSNFKAPAQTEEHAVKQVAQASAKGAKASKAPSEKVFCPQCGVQVEPGDRFCRTCGHDLSG